MYKQARSRITSDGFVRKLSRVAQPDSERARRRKLRVERGGGAAATGVIDRHRRHFFFSFFVSEILSAIISRDSDRRVVEKRSVADIKRRNKQIVT